MSRARPNMLAFAPSQAPGRISTPYPVSAQPVLAETAEKKDYLSFPIGDMPNAPAVVVSEPYSRSWWLEMARSCFAEFMGDLLFVFIGSMSTANAAGAPFAHGLTIALLVISLGSISGGHFNPAVTVGITVSGAIHPLRAIFYIFFQLAGGFIGALFVRVVSPDYANRNGITTLATNSAGVTVDNVGQAIILELILTYMLVQTVLCAAVDSDGKNTLAPLAIGFVVLVDIFAGGDITGASMNPARSFGPAAAASIFGSTIDPWRYHYVYWAGPIAGAVIAAFFYRLVLASEEKRLLR